MSQINQVPKGLQGFLGSKNFGKNPTELAQTVIPSLEMSPYYDSDLLRTSQVNGAFVGTTAISITTPADRVHKLFSIGCYLTNVAAAESCQVALRVRSLRDFNEAATVGVFSADGANGLADQPQGLAVVFPQPILLPPDSRVEALCTQFNGTSISFVFSAMYSPYNV